MANYLVTGGCGFIGSHLADALLAADHAVRILDDLSTGKRTNAPAAAELIVGDVADCALVAEAMGGMDGCYHLAAIASVQKAVEDWVGTHRVNLGGTIHVFEAARRARGGQAVPVVYASSAAVYGEAAEVPLTETAVLSPISAYGVEKFGCELYGRVAARVHGVPATGLRLFNVYGPRQDPASPYSGVIAVFADRIARDREIAIFGDGEQVRDFVYVGDAVRAFLIAMGALESAAEPACEVYNVCTGHPTSVRQLADILAEIEGAVPRVRIAASRAGDIRASIGNPEKAAAGLGFRAEASLADGLAATLASLDDAA